MLVAPLIGAVVIASGALIVTSASRSAAAIVGLNMGTSSTYGVLASSAITSAANSGISGTAGGDIGVGGATAHTGVISYSGTEVLGGISLTALTDAQSAFSDVRTSTSVGVELGGTTLTPGAYSNGTLGITGTLTLDGQGNPNAVFIFSTASTLITAANSSIALTNGAQACNVFWQVGSSATLGASSTMVGHVIASSAISTGASTNVNGQLIALTAAVTLGGTTVVNNGCASVPAAPVSQPDTSPNQANSISAAAPLSGPTTGLNRLIINGVFNTTQCPIVGIFVGSTRLAVGSWIETPNSVTFLMPAHSAGVVPITIYDGCVPVLKPISYTYVSSTPASDTAARGVLHIIKVVINNHSGTSVAATFNIIVRQNGKPVPLSPAPGVSGVGWALSLAPGSYDLSEVPTPGYRGVWSGPITSGGRVVITANHDISVTRTNYDMGVKASSTPTPTPSAMPSTSETPNGTVSGGLLPKTATNWGNGLMVGGALIFLGAIFYEIRKHRLTKKN